jgi:hypothetical protein
MVEEIMAAIMEKTGGDSPAVMMTATASED